MARDQFLKKILYSLLCVSTMASISLLAILVQAMV
jgi:hypothetical protein